MTKTPKPIALIILDGWGHRVSTQHNPIHNVPTPVMTRLMREYPYTLLDASGTAVGLPEGQIGNSEVGHLHIGAGRKILQDLTRISRDIETGHFFQNPVLLSAIKQAKQNDRAVHILGLLSSGGVHSHVNHIKAVVELVGSHGIKKNYLHAFLDGRDTPPQSAQHSLQTLTECYQQLGSGKIASIIGRYFAMDRDKRWERTQIAYDLMTQGIAHRLCANAQEALVAAYQHKQSDEFVPPTLLCSLNEAATVIEEGDIVIFMNFRADRARQLSHALMDEDFTGFERRKHPKLGGMVTLAEYDEKLNAKIAYPPETLLNTLGEYLSKSGLSQLRMAETEKYAHVTYFLNGGREVPFPNEERILIPSPKVATYDLCPEMNAISLTDQLIMAIESQRHDVIICNYANPDMLGHTGIESAAEATIKVIDACIGRVIDALLKVGGEAIITADHGNVEQMYDELTQQPHTAHTNNPVPFLYVGRPAKFNLHLHGALDDIAPTLLYLLGMPCPQEMTGQCLLQLLVSK